MITTPPITGNEDLDSFLYNVVSEISSGTNGSGINYNNTSGEITNAAGNVIGYIYRYIHIKYADDNVGTGISNLPSGKEYYGLKNDDLTTESNNPADYKWNQVDGGFGINLRSLFYKTTGNRTIQWDANTAGPDYTWVVDPGIAIDLDVIVLPQTISFNQVQDAAITELKIAAGAVTAAKTNIASIEAATGFLIANSVGTTQITDDAISAQKIQANSIVAGKIAANAVTASTIEANAITAVKINAGAVTAAKITVSELSAISANMGTITAGAISANTITPGVASVSTGRRFGINSTQTLLNSTAVLLGGTGETGDPGGSGGIIGYSKNNTYGMAGACYGATGPGGVFGNAINTNLNTWNTTAYLGDYSSAGIFNNFRFSGLKTQAYLASYNPVFSEHRGGYFQSYVINQNTAGACSISLAYQNYSAYANQGPYGPFTGSHDALLLKSVTLELGDIVVDSGFVVKKDISDTITKVNISNQTNQKGAVGVFSGISGLTPAALCYFKEPLPNSNEPNLPILKPEYEYLLVDNNIIAINSVGEGQVNVCGEGGNIEVGDLIVTSSIAGKGMKQSDDLIRNVTVAKSRENITFDSPTEIKQIACIYLAG